MIELPTASSHVPEQCAVCGPPMATAAYRRGELRATDAAADPVGPIEQRPRTLAELVEGAAPG